jgi:hypothetical protein
MGRGSLGRAVAEPRIHGCRTPQVLCRESFGCTIGAARRWGADGTGLGHAGTSWCFPGARRGLCSFCVASAPGSRPMRATVGERYAREDSTLTPSDGRRDAVCGGCGAERIGYGTPTGRVCSGGSDRGSPDLPGRAMQPTRRRNCYSGVPFRGREASVTAARPAGLGSAGTGVSGHPRAH